MVEEYIESCPNCNTVHCNYRTLLTITIHRHHEHQHLQTTSSDTDLSPDRPCRHHHLQLIDPPPSSLPHPQRHRHVSADEQPGQPQLMASLRSLGHSQVISRQGPLIHRWCEGTNRAARGQWQPRLWPRLLPPPDVAQGLPTSAILDRRWHQCRGRCRKLLLGQLRTSGARVCPRRKEGVRDMI